MIAMSVPVTAHGGGVEGFGMTEAEKARLLETLRAQVGRHGPIARAADPVNQPMIRRWCAAMADHNPSYLDPQFAARSIHGEIVAPPAMLVTWAIADGAADGDPFHSVLARLRAAGYSGAVGTSTEHEYRRYLKLGEVPVASQSVTDISAEKQTALGAGHFVTTLTEYRAAGGELLGSVKFVVLAYKPHAGGSGPVAGEPRPRRPRPGISRDTQFFWEGLKAGELRIQQCRGCATLHHPPRVRCHACGSYDFGYVVASGRGTVYSFVEPCHPRVPAFDYPYTVALVELAEGTRLITNLVDLDPEQVKIGMPVELVWRWPDPELVLPMFRPQRPSRRETTLDFAEVSAGDELPPCPVPITATLIVAGAIASGDFTDFHHDRAAAIKQGAPDIFMNILTTGGLCASYLSDWAGPEAVLRRLSLRLGVPNYPGDTMTLSGTVLSARSEGGAGLIEVGLRGYNRLGNHVTGRVELALPGARRGQ
ncbi:MAG: OB-fold domain-containing protein [Deltaproteobacteria bacterium]|nr:OB-fold domain-containing protein [Deltaproteobacteria bacterium]